jgi:hypothetical protein
MGSRLVDDGNSYERLADDGNSYESVDVYSLGLAISKNGIKSQILDGRMINLPIIFSLSNLPQFLFYNIYLKDKIINDDLTYIVEPYKCNINLISTDTDIISIIEPVQQQAVQQQPVQQQPVQQQAVQQQPVQQQPVQLLVQLDEVTKNKLNEIKKEFESLNIDDKLNQSFEKILNNSKITSKEMVKQIDEFFNKEIDKQFIKIHRLINASLNQLSDTKESMENIFIRLDLIINYGINYNKSTKLIYYYILNYLSKLFIERIETNRGLFSFIFPNSYIIVMLFNKYNELLYFILYHFYKENYIVMKIDDTTIFALLVKTNVNYIIGFYACIIQVDYPNNIYGIENGWKWIDNITKNIPIDNIKAHALPILLYNFLNITGERLRSDNLSKFNQLINTIKNNYLDKEKYYEPGVYPLDAHIVRLKHLIDRYDNNDYKYYSDSYPSIMSATELKNIVDKSTNIGNELITSVSVTAQQPSSFVPTSAKSAQQSPVKSTQIQPPVKSTQQPTSKTYHKKNIGILIKMLNDQIKTNINISNFTPIQTDSLFYRINDIFEQLKTLLPNIDICIIRKTDSEITHHDKDFILIYFEDTDDIRIDIPNYDFKCNIKEIIEQDKNDPNKSYIKFNRFCIGNKTQNPSISKKQKITLHNYNSTFIGGTNDLYNFIYGGDKKGNIRFLLFKKKVTPTVQAKQTVQAITSAQIQLTAKMPAKTSVQPSGKPPQTQPPTSSPNQPPVRINKTSKQPFPLKEYKSTSAQPEPQPVSKKEEKPKTVLDLICTIIGGNVTGGKISSDNKKYSLIKF